MNIVVLAKQVPDPEAFVEIRGDGAGLEIEPKFATNLFDEFALEEALRIREKHGGKVRVITLGRGKATEVLRTGIAMGADEALLLDDLFDKELPVLAGSDLVARAKAHALQGRLFRGVRARFAGRFKLDPHPTAPGVHDGRQPELRLRLADPPLAYNEPTHEIAAGCMRVLTDKRNL